jgi:hypothetical protein
MVADACGLRFQTPSIDILSSLSLLSSAVPLVICRFESNTTWSYVLQTYCSLHQAAQRYGNESIEINAQIAELQEYQIMCEACMGHFMVGCDRRMHGCGDGVTEVQC